MEKAAGPEQKTRHRSEQGRPLLFFVFLFAKRDRDNIDAPELAAFRKLAFDFGRCARADLDRLVELKAFVEVCHD
ncbi:hypothetical protein L665_04011 [Ralstonia solanacearum SD54]|nr:hypothetical protein L665_04011 [Ralstonia solanacearum SD54]